jgi:5-methylthioadenosine/S-adenosylhomocysteine deaminase
MGRYLVVGDPVVTLAEQDFVEDGALVIDGRHIVAVGPRERLEMMGPFERTIGSPQCFVMPGFINGHFHSGGAMSQGLLQYVFERANMYSHVNRGVVAEEDQFNATALSLIRCIRGGQTAAVDFSYGRPGMPLFGNEPILRAYEAVGFRGAVGLVTRDQNIYVHGDNETFLAMLPAALAAEVRASPMGYAWPADQVVAAYRELVQTWDGRDGRIRLILAPDWTPACSDALYLLNRRLADEYATGVTTHALETRSEMIFNLKSYGKTAMRRLADLNVLGPDVSCAHFVWATDEDIAIARDSGIVPVNNPGSNLRLSTGISRVRDIIDAGGRMAFGTDSISFSDREDFFQELRLAAFLQRIPGDIELGRLDTAKLLRLAATSGARALRFEKQLGSLEPGKEADLLVLKRDRIFWPPGKYAQVPVLDVILDRADAGDLDSVLIAGRVVLDQGRITTVDEAKIEAAVEDAAQRRLYVATEERRRWRELGQAVEPTVFEYYREWCRLPCQPAYSYNAKTPPDVGGLRPHSRTAAAG